MSFIAEVLSSVGHEVQGLPSGEEGLLFYNSRNPDVVIVDLGLPGISGLEVTSRIRRKGRPGTPIIATAGMFGVDESAREAGADAFLQKPFHVGELREMVDGMLRRGDCGPCS